MPFLRPYWRFLRVLRQFLPLILAWWRDRRRFLLFGGRRAVSSEERTRRAEELLDTLLTLGPTFIKLGQLLSTRPDVLPPEYVSVLSSLQDDVPPAEWEDAKRVLEAELGPTELRFHEFDTEAISGASLGQVYRARIDDQDVAVKVRRPGVESLVAADLRVIRWSLPVLLLVVDEARAFSLRNLADEFDKTIREEMDYERERRMLDEIRANFADEPKIAIPDTIDSHSSERVLTMEYLGGTKVDRIDDLDRHGIDRTEVAETLQRAYLEMIVEHGVFHADPHPGNLAVQDDGTIVFYDFGMSGRVDEFVQDKIVEFYVAVAEQDIDGILDALIEIGTLSPQADRAVMAEVMELAIQDARGEDIEQYRIQQIVGQIEDSIYEFPFRLPKDLALVLRVATVVEGVCVTLDPNFDFIATATEYLTEEGYREETIRNVIEDTGDQLQRSGAAAVRIPPKLESALDRVERENVRVKAEIQDSNELLGLLAKRLLVGMLAAAGVVATTILYVAASIEATAVAAGATVFLLLVLYRSFRRRRGIRAQPQFTRQNLRARRGPDEE
ncbi:putative unusual protein kinase [Salinarchaeum sp. Harcht-Bsk1]|uniref:ABC1 kinase family protein n=1 Tax=Salinarchaeum sp. Harcht-Bsk1 TaxID=1333523 RepID=UPI00034247DB|nr:AarF/ABC1/UbiB kinase family protein [Salinarchaeum sp. Harcht-Bsk1]AGN00637.1 putative unusual protein kinase [Salinarchaeum sp. Harcht-Bsk1]